MDHVSNEQITDDSNSTSDVFGWVSLTPSLAFTFTMHTRTSLQDTNELTEGSNLQQGLYFQPHCGMVTIRIRNKDKKDKTA